VLGDLEGGEEFLNLDVIQPSIDIVDAREEDSEPLEAFNGVPVVQGVFEGLVPLLDCLHVLIGHATAFCVGCL